MFSQRYLSATICNGIYVILFCFIFLGLIERLGYLWLRCHQPKGCTGSGEPQQVAPLPKVLPHVCTQLAMYNESAVAVRSIDAACALDWPRDRYEVQVLDDSTDAAVRAVVDAAAANWRARGVDCHVLRRAERVGYKAGALEAGRRRTTAEFLALFDADFVPPPDFLQRIMPSFYDGGSGEPHGDLALVQAQWSHLNMCESWLTLAQSLWIDDHHVSQMNWRSSMWQFVNFTGTAGVWRASAIETAGGWRAASLVEDCELSFRVLFSGYRTAFLPIAVPSELPSSVTAYKAQQKRWTLGWAQLLRLHLGTLLWRHECSLAKRVHLLYHMLLSIQWPLWLAWQVLTPWLLMTLDRGMPDEQTPESPAHSGRGAELSRLQLAHWLGMAWSSHALRSLFYVCPLALHMLIASTVAAVERCDAPEVRAAFVPDRKSVV